ncbi:hypothetical protein ACH5RR_002952 [Cinchona calisaya]|uniref:Uncharacterized protein n=1 Tax=Cinchona calisaya TaxID=153742 RepID=A0ABD3ATH2_9GENT
MRLLRKINLTSSLMENLRSSLSFLGSSLMENLLLLLMKNPIKEMESLAISTRALIFKTGSFICKSPDSKEDERMADYCCLKLPDLLATVDNLKLQASDLFNEYFFFQQEVMAILQLP